MRTSNPKFEIQVQNPCYQLYLEVDGIEIIFQLYFRADWCNANPLYLYSEEPASNMGRTTGYPEFSRGSPQSLYIPPNIPRP
jgi:hypothetical protein